MRLVVGLTSDVLNSLSLQANKFGLVLHGTQYSALAGPASGTYKNSKEGQRKNATPAEKKLVCCRFTGLTLRKIVLVAIRKRWVSLFPRVWELLLLDL